MYTRSEYDLNETVFSTGFNTSLENIWIPPGLQGKIVNLDPYKVLFPNMEDPVAILRSDIARTQSLSFKMYKSGRDNTRYVQFNAVK